MTDTNSLDFFRAVVQLAPADQTPLFHLVSVPDGYILENSLGSRLKTVRGSVRVFSSADTAIRFVAESIAGPSGRFVEVRIGVGLRLLGRGDCRASGASAGNPR